MDSASNDSEPVRRSPGEVILTDVSPRPIEGCRWCVGTVCCCPPCCICCCCFGRIGRSEVVSSDDNCCRSRGSCWPSSHTNSFSCTITHRVKSHEHLGAHGVYHRSLLLVQLSAASDCDCGHIFRNVGPSAATGGVLLARPDGRAAGSRYGSLLVVDLRLRLRAVLCVFKFMASEKLTVLRQTKPSCRLPPLAPFC